MKPAAGPDPTHYVFSDITGVLDMSDRDDYIGMGAIVVRARDALRLERLMCELKDRLYPGHDPLVMRLRGTDIRNGNIAGIGDAVPPPYAEVFGEIVDMLCAERVTVVHFDRKKDEIGRRLDPDDVRREVWGEFFGRCDGLFVPHGMARAQIVHDSDKSWRHIARLLGEHVRTHGGCALDPAIQFVRSLFVNMLQAADIVAYVGRQASSRRGEIRREFEPWRERLYELAGGGPRAGHAPP
ncbi:MAG: hypothetical protein OXU85_00835 [Thaumarchaeota archaeon]|nr:hypothetical protein [Nitrososphaerota archaeon]